MSERIRLAIIEDGEHVQDSLREFFAAQDNIHLLNISDSVEDYLKIIESGNFQAPDVILSDINLPGMSGIEGIRHLKFHLPNTDIIMLTVFNDSNRIFQALCAGATGYALKSTPMPELLKAIIEIKSGGSYMSPSIARKVIDYFAPTKKQSDGELSPRELQVIQGLTDGLSYKMIADRLSVSIDTIRTHIKNIYRKLQVNSKTEVLNKVFKGDL